MRSRNLVAGLSSGMGRGLKLALAVAGVLAIAPAPRAAAQMNPAESLKALKAGEGLSAQTFASEPMFGNPCDMDVDSKGRVWVTEGWNYRGSKLRPAGDRIMVLEDTDGDGKADKAHVFYQGPEINSALGICVLGDKVIVSCAPNVLLFEDKDGDLKADGPPKVLFSGISGVQHDHAIHTFTFGPDGKLYFNFGNAGKQLKTADGKPVIDLAGNEVADKNNPYRQGMVFRCDLEGTDLKNVETLAWNFRNNYEVAVDSFGTLWQSDNDDDGNRGVRINYVMEYGNYGYQDESNNGGWQAEWAKAQARGATDDLRPFYHWHQFDPGVVPNLLQTGAGSPTGICVYEGKLLPQQFWGQMIHCEPGANVVRAYPVSNDGAGYKASIVNIIKSDTDRWFRPADVCVAPDGSLMVADWYDPGVGGHATGDKPKPGDSAAAFQPRGRVYRVAPSSAPKYTIPAIDLSTPAGAAGALASPNLATRYLAWTKLHDLGTAAEPELLKMWQNPAEPRLRARALQLLARIKGSEAKYIAEALADKDSDIRITALRIGKELKQDLLPIIKTLAKDPSPQVRREAAIALRFNKSADAAAIWTDLATQYDGKDKWYLEALGIGAAGQEDAFLTAYLAKTPDAVSTPAGRDIIWRSRTAKAAPLLAKIIQDPATPKDQLVKFFRAFDFIGGEAKTDALLAILNGAPANKTILVETLGRLKNLDPAKAAAVKGQVARLLDGAKGTPEFVQLCEQFDVTDRGDELVAFVAAHPTDVAAAAALRVIVKNNPASLEKGLAGPDGAKVAGALAASTDRSIVTTLEKIAGDAKRNLPIRQAAISALTKSKNGAKAVLDLAAKGKLADDVKPLAAALLHNSSHKDIRDEAIKLMPPPVAKGAEKLPAIDKLIAMKGNAAHGKELFTSATCYSCHIISGYGTQYGPELSEIGNKLSREALFTSIIYPNAGISVGFEGSIISTKDGDDLDGMVISDTADEIILRRAGGINTPIKKSQIKERRPMKLSIMPEGLVQTTMSTQDLVDLVEYLSAQKKAGK